MSTAPEHDPTRLDEAVLKAAEELLRETSQGPWTWEEAGGRVVSLRSGPWASVILDAVRTGLTSAGLRTTDPASETHRMVPAQPQHPDLRFISAARVLLPVLLAEVSRAHDLIDEREVEIRRLEHLLASHASHTAIRAQHPHSNR